MIDRSRRRARCGIVAFILFALGACQDKTGLPVSGAEPAYEPAGWTEPPMPEAIAGGDALDRLTWMLETEAGRSWFRLYRVRSENNCYNYACDRKNTPVGDPFSGKLLIPAQPGRGGGYNPPSGWCRVDFTGREFATRADDPQRGLCLADVTCAVLRAASLADGLVATDCTAKCADGSYKKALVVDPLTAAEKADAAPDRNQTDYHWYRQNPDGTWSHKRGQAAPTNLGHGKADGSDAGKPITDPRAEEARGTYTEFCDCFCCGKDVKKAERGPLPSSQLAAIVAQLPTGPDVAAEPGVSVVAQLFSGRRDPRWTITDPATMQELARRTNLQALVRVPDPQWPILGPIGYSIETADPAVLRTGLFVPGLAIFRGAIRIGDRYYRDDLGLEAWIEANWPGGPPRSR